MTFGSLFAGIGGFDLGLERAGMTCKWQVEIDPDCLKVLSRHWPDVPKFHDITRFEPASEQAVDLICGGFPCQDISNAGKRVGIDGARSGLWREFARVIRSLRPKYVIVENVDSLATRGLTRVLGDLASLGYDAEWSLLPVCALGFPHPRKRLFVVAYAEGQRPGQLGRQQFPKVGDAEWHLCQWRGEPEPVRVDYGVPGRLDRNRMLGNSVCPAAVELIGHYIQRMEIAP